MAYKRRREPPAPFFLLLFSIANIRISLISAKYSIGFGLFLLYLTEVYTFFSFPIRNPPPRRDLHHEIMHSPILKFNNNIILQLLNFVP